MDVKESIALWFGQEADSPVVAVAVHAGHALRDEIAAEFYMDEHTGEIDERTSRAVGDALVSSVAAVRDELHRLPV